MSAWLVSKKHIDVLVAAVLQNGGYRHRGNFIKVIEDAAEWTGTGDCFCASELGEMLWRENHKSINSRYSSRTRTPLYTYRTPKEYMVEDTSWNPVRHLVDPAILAKQVSCYDYQSCEHADYYRSHAASVVAQFAKALLGRVEGYEQSPWGVD